MPAASPLPLIVLDRDGTLNMDDQSIITSPRDWRPLPGALEAVAKLNQAGWRVVIATNQSGLGLRNQIKLQILVPSFQKKT